MSEIGLRRSALWLRMHFFAPAEVSGASIMPSYAFLFRDFRGDDLIAYLESLRGPGSAQQRAEEEAWQRASSAIAEAKAGRGRELYQRDCATRHNADGRTRIARQSSFRELPVDLATGPYRYLALAASPPQRLRETAHIAKFGIPGTDMAGHEYLSDADISSLALWLSQRIAQPGGRS